MSMPTMTTMTMISVGLMRSKMRGVTPNSAKRCTTSFEPGNNIVLCTYTVKPQSKGKKNVPIRTTRRPVLGQTRDDDKKKPAIYKHYDFTKGGTDIMDQKIGKYSNKCTTQLWPLVSFFYVLDTARNNAKSRCAA